MRHMTETRPDDGQPNVIKAPKRYAREEYAETAAHGLGHVYAIVIQSPTL